MGKTRVDIDIGQIMQGITRATDETVSDLVSQIVKEARASTLFRDETGTLRRSIKKAKSKYGSGFLAKASAPHAHLVEYDHIAQDGTVVEGKHFLRTAAYNTLTETNIASTARKVFRKEGY